MAHSNIDFAPVLADEQLHNAIVALVQLASREDLQSGLDITSAAIVPSEMTGTYQLCSRQAGIVAGLVTVPWILQTLEVDVRFQSQATDGQPIAAGQILGTLQGNVRQLLTAERIVLNILSRMSGVATLTNRYTKELAGTNCRLYDTRKTTPGWRRLEKYAVRCGGGNNHRSGLYDAILIKDNHLALGGEQGSALSPDKAIGRARHWLSNHTSAASPEAILIEIEVDSLTQLKQALTASPDIVLVDNFSLEELAQAVAIRNATAPTVELEASGGVTIATLAKIAATGVDRVSCGAITHQAVWLDFGLDWIEAP